MILVNDSVSGELYIGSNLARKVYKGETLTYDFARFVRRWVSDLGIAYNFDTWECDLTSFIAPYFSEENTGGGVDVWIAPDGNNANPGTEISPVKTFGAAMALSPDRMLCKPGNYYNAGSGFSPPKPLKILAPAGRANFIKARDPDSLTWVEHVAGVWTTDPVYDMSGARSEVFDTSVLNTESTMTRYTRVALLADCISTPLSWFSPDADTIYINTGIGATPSQEIYMLSDTLDTPAVITTKSVWLENVSFIGGKDGCFSYYPADLSVMLYAKDVEFLAALYRASLRAQGSLTVMDNCTCHSGLWDAFNYHDLGGVLPVAIEYNCTSSIPAYAGEFDPGLGQIHNATTMHDAGQVVRINGTYKGQSGPVVADVGGSRTLNLTIDAEFIDSGQPISKAAIHSSGGKAYLIDCSASGTLAIENTSGGKIYVDAGTTSTGGTSGSIVSLPTI